MTPPSSPSSVTPGAVAPGTLISYHPELLEHLRQDHQELLTLLAAIAQLLLEQQLDQALGLLARLRRDVQSHVLRERVQLYVYLEHLLASGDPAHALVHKMHRQLNGIASQALALTDRHEQALPTAGPSHPEELLHDIETLTQMLVGHMQQEEDVVYPLYQHPVG